MEHETTQNGHQMAWVTLKQIEMQWDLVHGFYLPMQRDVYHGVFHGDVIEGDG